jgi:hypothetical protein
MVLNRHYPPDVTPFTSEEDYWEHRRRMAELKAEQQRLSDLRDDLRERDPQRAEEVLEEIRAVIRQGREVLQAYGYRMPLRLHGRCPFCAEPVYWKIDLFDLAGPWWSWPFVPREYKVPTCEHVLCVDGALNLEGHTPEEVTGGRSRRINIAAEVPFVKPRMLELGNVIAVVHRIPEKIGGCYTGYPIVYFGNPRPSLSEGSLGWACTEFHNERGMWNIIYDVQDYDLDTWIAAGKLCWLDPDDPEHPLVCGPPPAYPFRDLPGRRASYCIRDGKVLHGLPTNGTHGYP